MKAEVEVYRGIEFVRLSVLTREQAKAIRSSSFGKKVIKILQGNELLPDCLPWSSYNEWYNLSLPAGQAETHETFLNEPDRVKLVLK